MRGRFRSALVIVATVALLSGFALPMLVAAIATGFRARRFNTDVLGRALGRAVLRVAGVRLSLNPTAPFRERQAVYIANHTSTLDPFLLLAAGIPNTRYLMKEEYLRIPPMAAVGLLIGIFWTAPQSRPDERRRRFQRIAEVLGASRESVFLSPEGMRVTSGSLGHFNKGAFHLATALGAPIVPLYIDIPAAINPGLGLVSRPGNVVIHVLDEIGTTSWRLGDLERNRDMVRERMLAFERQLHRQRRAA